MKNMTKSIVALFAILTMSCNSDDVQDRPIIQGVDSPVLGAPGTGSVFELLPQNGDSQIERFVWSKANYNGNVEINYTLEIDKTGGDFSAAKILGETNIATQVSVTTTALNAACTALGAVPFVSSSFDVRVVSNNAGFDKMASNKVTIIVKTFTTALPTLAVPGNHQGWNPPTAPKLAASAYGKTDFEGFVWLDGGYKFVTANATGGFEWNQSPDFADDGTFSGILTETNETNCNASTAGYYYVKANTGATGPGALTYSAQPTSWGIAGNATTNGWDGSMPMTYNATSKTWTIITTLSTQAAPDNGLKFKANGGWDINLGDNGANGSAEFGGTNISTTAGTYKITLDLSNPRDYKYTVVPN
jgi:starch-binding outer membrane protein SusE/F